MDSKQQLTRHSRHKINLAARQNGIALVMFVIGLLGVLLIGGLALDSAHVMLNKTRLQNSVDAAALAAASVLDSSTSVTDAEAAARAVFAGNSAAAGNREMNNLLAAADVVVEFSADLDPFISGTGPAEYVRVSVQRTKFMLPKWLVQVASMKSGATINKYVGASAVAGPSPTLGHVCDLVPLIICGDPDQPAPFFGYQDDEVTVLKGGSKSGSSSTCGDIGSGNFQLAQIGGSGANVVRENLAGGYEGCSLLGDTIETSLGVEAGPVAQGINTRLGLYAGPISPADYPPDVVTETPSSDISYDEAACNIMFDGEVVQDSGDIDFNYTNYQDRVAYEIFDHSPTLGGAYDRRNMAVVIADCGTGSNTGQSSLPILGFGCFFLLQEVKQKGNEAEMYGEFVADCNAKGAAGPLPTNVPGPHTIQLYNDPDSKDS